tara:strand:+ start:505 stop:753 length:249 start_codon:yes stop_codon:yes gene_type:complete
MGKPKVSLEAGGFLADLTNEKPLYYVAIFTKREKSGVFEPWQNFRLSLEDFGRFQEDGRALRSALIQLQKLYPDAPEDTLMK